MTISILSLNKKGIEDFAKERNVLLSKAKTEWVFFVDSDEEISKGLAAEIVDLDAGDYRGFYVLRKNYFLGHYIGTDKILRVGKKGSGKWKRRVHETWEIEGKVGQLKNPLIHNSAKSLHEFIGKLNKYSTLHAQEHLSNGETSNLVKIACYPVFKFIQSLLMGRGYIFSMLQSFHSFLAWSKIWLYQKG